MKAISIALCASIAAAGCATPAAKVAAIYEPPAQYANLDCAQLKTELLRVSDKVREVSGAQDRKARNDKIATGVGVVLFWPALFFLAAGDKKKELGKLKGEYDALSATAKQKNCPVAKELSAST